MRIRPAFDRYPGMPVFPEEPEIHESIPGPGVPFPRESDAKALSTPAAGSASSTSPSIPSPSSVPVDPARPGAPAAAAAGSAGSVRTVPTAAVVPGPRPGPPRPAAPRPGPPKPGPRPAQAAKPAPSTTAPGPSGPAAPPGPTVQLVPATPQTALERADEAVDLLLESGRDPGGILVLTAASVHPWQQHELTFGEEHYWAQLAEGNDVFYASLALTRPARRDVVVLVLDGASADGSTPEQAVQRALGHAVSLLIVCGDTGQPA